MIFKLNLLIALIAAQATEEECLAEPQSIWDAATTLCTPCDAYTHADEAGTACIADTCEATQILLATGVCEACAEGSAPDADGKVCEAAATTDETATETATTDDTTAATDETATTDTTTTDETATTDEATTTDETATTDDTATTDETTTDDTKEETAKEETSAACPSGQKADPLGKCRDVVAENTIRTNLRLSGSFADFVQDTFKEEIEAQLGATVNILDAYEGSIVVVFEVASSDISLGQMTDKFGNGQIKLSYGILDVSSESTDEEINIIKGGKLTHAAKMKLVNVERDKKVNLIFGILGLSVIIMICFVIFICCRQRQLFNQYVSKHVQLTNIDSARTNDNEK